MLIPGSRAGRVAVSLAIPIPLACGVVSAENIDPRNDGSRFAPFLATTAMVLAGFLASGLAAARIVNNTINPVATLTDDGRHLVLTGPIQCDGNQPADLRLTVTQRSTGAIAEGTGRIDCTPGLRQWEVRAETQGQARFAEGPATGVGLAITSTGRGDADDAHQWRVEVIVVEEEAP